VLTLDVKKYAMRKKVKPGGLKQEHTMPTGDNDSVRRTKWSQKAATKRYHIDQHKKKLKEEEENRPYRGLVLEDKEDKKAKQQTHETQKDKDQNALAFQKLKEVINDGQRALGAFNPEIKIMPDLPTDLPNNTEHIQEEEKEAPKQQEKSSFLTRSRQRALTLWNTCKMHKRKDQLTRLIICAVCIVVIIFALVAMSILSWFSHGSVTTNAPQLPHTILF